VVFSQRKNKLSFLDLDQFLDSIFLLNIRLDRLLHNTNFSNFDVGKINLVCKRAYAYKNLHYVTTCQLQKYLTDRGENTMHNGCSGDHESGKQIVDKIRMMGFNSSPLEAALEITCTNCDTIFQMEHMESSCSSCGMVYGVTPCHSNSAQFVKAAGINY